MGVNPVVTNVLYAYHLWSGLMQLDPTQKTHRG